MEIDKLLKELKLLEYIDKNKTNKNMVILPVSRLKDFGVSEEEQFPILDKFYDNKLIDIIDETNKEKIFIRLEDNYKPDKFIDKLANLISGNKNINDVSLGIVLPSYPFPKYIVEIKTDNFYPYLEKIRKEVRERKLELPETEKIRMTFPYKLPRGIKWENITIKFLDDEKVWINAHQFKHETDFKEMGFIGKGNKPSVQWIFLKVLANHNGEINWGDKEANKRFKKQAQLLAEGLQNYFKLDYDPFYPYKDEGSYKIKLLLIPSPEKETEVKPNKKDRDYNRDEDIKDFYNEITRQS